MKLYQKIMSSIVAISVAGLLSACDLKKDEKKVDPKPVKVEKIVKKEEVAPKPQVSVEALSKKVDGLSVRVKRLEDAAKARGLVQ